MIEHRENKKRQNVDRGNTVFERRQTLVGDLKLKRGREGRWIVENCNVSDIHSAHCP